MQNATGEFQTIVLLGGRSEIGRAIAAHLASPFTRKVVLAGRNLGDSDAESFRRQMSELGPASPEISLREFDALDVESHREFAESFEEEGVDLVIAAFGQLGDHDAMLHDPRLAAQLVSVNMTGMVSSGLAFGEILSQQGRGRLLFISSVAGVRTRQSNFIYGSTKAGMDAFAQGLADQLHPKGVEVTILRPGFVRTAMTQGMKPAPFATDPDSVARHVAQGLRKGKRVIWSPGILWLVFSLLRALPTPVWRRLPIN